MRRKSLVNLLLLTIPLFLFSCVAENPSSLDPSKADNDNNIRSKGVFNAAFTFGAQSGLSWQANNIEESCKSNANELSKIYNFNALLMQHNLLPPVVVEANNSLRLTSNTMRLSDKIVEIITPAHFVSTPPSWRDYLLMGFKQPEPPNNTLLPKTMIERQMWDEAIQKGWDEGVSQANRILLQNLGRLNRDFSGITLYHSLKAQNMISAPTTAKANLGITGNNQRMQINDKIIRITSHSNLNYQRSKQWSPALISNTKIPGRDYVARK